MIGLLLGIPVDPDRPEARRLLTEELAKSEYQQAKPTWFDQLLGSIVDWFEGLQGGGGTGTPAFGLLVVLIVVAALLVISFLVFGLPRINRRSRVSGSLFGEDDARSAAQIRAAAEAAAARGDHATAVAEMFRAIARGLAERTILTTSPGTTAHDFATRAGTAFPSLSADLAASAAAFDDVRYLGGAGTSAQYALVETLERRLRSARPVVLEAVDS